MSTPPTAPQRPHAITRHGDTRVDPYYWLMDRENEEVLSYLRAENDYLAERLAHLKPLEDELFAEIKGHIDETDTSVPVRRGQWWYFERTREGLNYPVAVRTPVLDPTSPPVVDPLVEVEGEQVILDENVEAEGHDFLNVGVLSVSPDDRWVAVGTDFEGAERFTVTVRPLLGQPPVDDVLEDAYYGFTWATDARHVFYTRVDDAMRPWQLWRHEIGTAQSSDVLVYQEDDAQYTVSVGRTRDDQVIVVVLESSMTTEVRYLPAAAPTEELRVIEARRHGIEYGVEHYLGAAGRGWWLKLTNEGARDFRLLAREDGPDAGPWREIVPERPGSRLDGVDAFAGLVVLSERIDGCAAVRLCPLAAGEDPFAGALLAGSRVVEAPAFPSTVGLGANPNFETDQIRVGVTSLVTPHLVADVDRASGELIVRKQQRVLGDFDERNYVTGRLWVTASDGVEIPVSYVGRADVLGVGEDGERRPGAPAPVLLYGYGSYEISIDPGFSALRLTLLDRGVIFAIAHIRGGGEMGRAWYEMGRLAQKATTFSDFVTVARHLVDAGWTTSDRLAIRGGSAGGLLMGASLNLDPSLYRAVVAEVPFVDVLTTMLDDSLPLTVGEWEEWGNPDASATAYRIMKGYSPYDNLRDVDDEGRPVHYPDLYVTGGLNDSRVGFWEPAKWVLALRDHGAANVVLKTEMGAGHHGPSGRYDAWRDEAQVQAWILDEIAPGATKRA